MRFGHFVNSIFTSLDTKYAIILILSSTSAFVNNIKLSLFHIRFHFTVSIFEWKDLKNKAWPSRWYELEAVRNNSILVESWLTFWITNSDEIARTVILHGQSKRNNFQVTITAICRPYFALSFFHRLFSIHIDYFQIWSISTWP